MENYSQSDEKSDQESDEISDDDEPLIKLDNQQHFQGVNNYIDDLMCFETIHSKQS